MLSFFEKEWFQVSKPERFCQLSIVSESWMRIQRQMGAVNSEVVVQQQLDHLVPFIGPWVACSPKKAMMHNEQIGFRFDRFVDRRKAAVDRCRYFCDAAAVLHLQSVYSAGPIFKVFRRQSAVAIL